jgi:ATP-dependent DNA helicase DinG
MSNEYFEKLAQKLPGFEIRPGQQQMFQDVCAAYEKESTCLIEAGTGIGKSLAYLIPALLWALQKGEPTVIATHTIALQEQLMQKDIPFLIDALGVAAKAVLAKGMQNYVCLRKLHDTAIHVPESILVWSTTSTQGSKSELPLLPSAELWEQIGAESESCTRVKCPHYKECFFFKARAELAEAHLIVANHHLVFADLAVRIEKDDLDKGAILPPYQRLILDEAHHCEDVATHYFARVTSRRSLILNLGRLISDRGIGKLVTLYQKLTLDYPAGRRLAESLTILLPNEKRQVAEQINGAFDALSTYFATHVKEDKCRVHSHHLTDPQWISQVHPPFLTALEEAERFVQAVLLLEKQVHSPDLVKCEGVLAEIKGICSHLGKLLDHLRAFVFSPLEPKIVRWIEGHPSDLRLIAADLEIAPRLADSLFNRLPTIILCSATLCTQGSFAFVRSRLGIKEAEERVYPSPFCYRSQACLAVPTDLPDPSHPNFVRSAAERIWEAVQISGGGLITLFTSYSMLKECASQLKEQMHRHHYNLYCQGEAHRTHLLHQFRETNRSVLFGTDSFWEGVDVAGDALRCVVIVKLPFKVPSDPLFEARSEAIAALGKSPFFEYSLPQAIVKFKQGFGRLIRTQEDRGCVICLDTRLVTKGYGKYFLESLPPCLTHFEPTATIQKHLKSFYQQLI